MNFKQIDEARKTLGLGEEASIREIQEAFRRLALRYHPDRRQDKDKKVGESLFKKINEAKDMIDSYCVGYRYSFREKDVKKNSISKEEYEHLKRFYDGWIVEMDF